VSREPDELANCSPVDRKSGPAKLSVAAGSSMNLAMFSMTGRRSLFENQLTSIRRVSRPPLTRSALSQTAPTATPPAPDTKTLAPEMPAIPPGALGFHIVRVLGPVVMLPRAVGLKVYESLMSP